MTGMSHPTGGHVSAPLALRYALGTAREPDARALERHIEGCGPCAARVSAAVRRGPAGAVLDDIRTAVLAEAAGRAPEHAGPAGSGRETPAPAGSVGLVTRLGWAAGPAVRRAWWPALLAVVGGALLLAYAVDLPRAARPLLLALSPVVPLLGVALSYGRRADPLHEIIASTPSGGLRLLLTRTAVVLLAGVVLLAAAGTLLPPATGLPGVPGPASWLLPGLALTLAALALGSYTGCQAAASALACGWLLAVLTPLAGSVPAEAAARLGGYVAGPAAQTTWAAAALLCAGLLALRRSSFDRLERV
ncbi:zf-HC2 domain-containing protein [Streptomyces yaizuensis]|uniref:Zf-HC2 domain-containing protein n=1 Tax=Streptomyces yaizuensis TaxID=2989713 RepID=A0ABQ5NW77_9ACTN|nr:zf-HC2 domain-containing protein [Streptomyces sp. YSPA8]GLF94618.1 zf-HC2 domain-containing protein [Streptomyces sp. YSPA8]